MRILVDTHALLWFQANDPALPMGVRERIEDNANDCLISQASVWEMAIKVSIQKLKLPFPILEFVRTEIVGKGFSLLPLSLEHVCRVEKLPFHHSDPFDRVLIGQLLIEQIPVISRDSRFDSYGVDRIW